jgi:hypothetical protein
MRQGHRWSGKAGQCWSCAAIGGLVGAVLLLGILLLSGWLANRGVRLGKAACVWDEQAGVYRASVTATNTESQPKVVSIWAQGRFRPREGRQERFEQRPQGGIVNTIAIELRDGAG